MQRLQPQLKHKRKTKKSKFLIDTLVPCKCGCGLFRKPYDVNGDRRFYIRWHPVKYSLEARRRMHLSHLGKKQTPEHNLAISKSLLGNQRAIKHGRYSKLNVQIQKKGKTKQR
jgi:hypothetical protein